MDESDEGLFEYAVQKINLEGVEIPQDDDELKKVLDDINSDEDFQNYKQKFDGLDDYQSKKKK